MLNEGLETLGTEECGPDGRICSGVFEESGLERVRLPSTLKKIEGNTFLDCERLKKINFPEGLEHIRMACFLGTGLESVEFPASLRTVEQSAFSLCESLKYAKFNEGLEVLGADEYPPKDASF